MGLRGLNSARRRTRIVTWLSPPCLGQKSRVVGILLVFQLTGNEVVASVRRCREAST